MKRIFWITAFVLAMGFTAKGQPTGYFADAISFSRTMNSGSARYLGLGSAGVSLGADMSTANINPAGLGLYRNSAFSISTGLGFAGSTTNYLGDETRDNRQYLFFPNFGFAVHSGKEDFEEGSFRGGTFAVTYSRLNDFQNRFRIRGENDQNSMLDYFAQSAVGFSEQELVEDYNDSFDGVGPVYPQTLPYGTFLIDPVYMGTTHSRGDPWAPLFNPSVVDQEQTVTTKGAINQWDISYGANFDDRFYIGASLGVLSARYALTKSFTETITDENIELEDFTWSEDIKTNGIGVNFNLGMIYKATDFFRLGLKVSTPTIFSLKEQYQYGLVANFDNYTYYSGYTTSNEELNTPVQEFRYTLTLPARASGGFSYFFGKNGFISAEVEVVPYGTTMLRDEFGSFDEDNDYIRENYKMLALNYNLGAEYRAGVLRFRAGVAYQADPEADPVNNSPQWRFSLGSGVRLESFYFDVALLHSRISTEYSPYSVESGGPYDFTPTADVLNKNTSAVFTFGTYF